MQSTKKIISCDWGTSSFRLRLVELETGLVLSEVNDNDGIAKIHNLWLKGGSERELFYLNYLASKIKKLNASDSERIPVFISGMASSSIGIRELPYHATPFILNGTELDFCKFGESYKCFLFTGLRTETDVMRGEETILLGCDFSENAVVILPGTHSKHARINHGVLSDFRTFMTGEFFNLLSTQSILKDGLEEPLEMNYGSPWFKKGLEKGYNENLLNTAFQVRTNILLQKVPKTDNYHFLSGIVVGTELKNISKYEPEIHLVSEGRLLDVYKKAFELLDFKANVKCTEAGRAFVRGHLKLAMGGLKKSIF